MERAGTTLGRSYLTVLELYEGARFVDAFAATQELWADKSNALKLGAPEAVLAARLASRLGGAKFSRALFDLARELDPKSPLVRYYCRHRTHRQTLFDELKDFVADPELSTDDIDLKASWFASHAATFSLIRDFDNAQRFIERAHAQNSPRGWVHSCHADILAREDRRDEALKMAEEAWKRQPGMPYTAGSLSSALAELGRGEEAVTRLRTWLASGGQSFEVMLQFMRALLQSMERGNDESRASGARELYDLAARFEQLAPLADRFARRALNYNLIEAARLSGDHARLTELAARLDWPFYNSVAANLAKNPGGKRLVLPHKPVRQDHNTCLPASVCTVLSTQGVAVEQQELGRELTFEGTPSYRVNDWAEKKGFVVRHFIADRAGVEALLSAGLSFVIGFEYLNNAHACAVVGADFALGTLLIHDPSSVALSEQLLEFLDKGEAPLGPRCVVIYPKAQAEQFAAIKLKGEQEASARLQFQRVRDEQGALEAARYLEKAGVDNSPQGEFLKSWALSSVGRARESIEVVKRLVAQWPDCVVLQRALIGGTEALGDTAQTREELRKILARSPLPGASQGAEYIYPAPHLYARYADLLRRSAVSHAEAMRVSQQALRRGPFEPEAYVVRGEIHWHLGQFAEALFPYRCASTLHYENDTYARYYAEALHKLGREREAVEWLEKRARHFVEKLDAAGPWRVLADTLEDFGFPGEALEKLHLGLKLRPQDGSLAAFGAIFLSRYAQTAQAAAALEVARQHATKGEYHNAASALARMEGNAAQALEHAQKRVEHEPTSINARGLLLHTLEQVKGPDEALKLCEQWVSEHAGDEDYENLLLDRLDRGMQRERRVKLLRERLARNDADAWAWRELTFTLLESAGMATATRRIDAARELDGAVARCEQTCPDHPATAIIRTEYMMVKGRREEAFKACTRALEIDPAYSYAFNRLFDIAQMLGGAYPRQAADIADAALWRTPGQWSLAPNIADRLGQVLGVDEARTRVSRWLRRARRDPYPVSAWAEMLLDHGRGVADARRVVRRLSRAVARFPLHINLRYALAHAYSNLQRPDDEVQALRGIIECAPRETRARVLLSETLEFLGKGDQAAAELNKAADLDPLDHRVWMALAAYHERQGDLAKAIEAVATACAKLPDNMNLWERRIALLEKAGRLEELLAAARDVAKRYPDGALAQLILARAMRTANVRARRRDVEAQYEKALSLNAQFYEAVDEYTDFLCVHTEYDKAREIINRHLRTIENPDPLRAKLAEILRAEKRNKEALDAIVQLVRERPDYYWGWKLLLEWSAADKRFEPAKSMLKEVPPRLEANAVFGAERLEFLEQAKAPKAQTEEGWQQLIENFPQNREINLRRADRLLEAKRFKDAAQLMERYAGIDPDDAQTLSRLVRVHCALKNNDVALIHAHRLWFEANGESWGACEDSVDALEKANAAGVNLSEVCKRVAAGALPLPVATRVLAFKAGKAGVRQPLVEFAELIEKRALEYGSWDVFTSVLDGLEEAGESKWVINFSVRQEQLCRDDPQLWMIVGRALRMDGRYAQCAKWFAGWRQRPAVEMWGISNALWSLVHLGRYAECLEMGEAALAELEHDHSAPYLVEGMLLATVLNGDARQVLFRLEELRDVLARADKRSPLQEALDLYEAVQGETSTRAILALDKRFAKLLSDGDLPLQPALASAWRKALMARLSWAGRMWYWLTRNVL